MPFALRAALAALTATMLLCVAGPSRGEPAPSEQTEIEAASAAAAAAAVKGPARIALADRADLTLAPGQSFVPREPGMRLLGAMGVAPETGDFLGLVTSAGATDDWMVVVRFVKDGFIRDEDAGKWSADDLLTGVRHSIEADNADRRRRGFSEMDVLGWVETPTYEMATHRLTWSILSKPVDAPDEEKQSVTYNTLALGRDGYVALDMMSDTAHIPSDRLTARGLLGNLTFRPGKRYEDFAPRADAVAPYRIAALVGGLAGKKFGIHALAAAFVARFAALIFLAVALLGAVVAKIYVGRSRPNRARVRLDGIRHPRGAAVASQGDPYAPRSRGGGRIM